jgi:hypothetical protein
MILFRCSHHAYVDPPAGNDKNRTANRQGDVGDDAHNSPSVGRPQDAHHVDGISILTGHCGPPFFAESGDSSRLTKLMVVLTGHCGPPFFAESGDSSRLTTTVILIDHWGPCRIRLCRRWRFAGLHRPSRVEPRRACPWPRPGLRPPSCSLRSAPRGREGCRLLVVPQNKVHTRAA